MQAHARVSQAAHYPGVTRPRLACLAFTLSLLSSAGAACASPLTLQQTVRYAMEHNPTVSAKQAALAEAQAQYTRQRAAQYPSVVGSLQNVMEKQSNYGGSLAQYGIAPIPNFSQNTAQVGSQWTVYNGSYNQIVAQQWKRKVDAAKADLRQTQVQTTAKIVNMFFSIADAAHLTGLARANLAYQQALLAVAQANERVGMIAGVDVLRAQVAVAQSQAAVLTTQSDEATARESLAQAIGAGLDTQFAVPKVLPAPPLPAGSEATLVNIALQNRPDVAVAVADVAIAQLSRSSIDTDLLPQISVYAAFGNQTSPTDFVSQQEQIDTLNSECGRYPNQIQCIGYPFANVVRGMPGFWDIGASSSFSLPIVDYGTRATEHQAANAEVKSAQLALDSAKTAAEEDVVDSLRSAQTAQATLVYHRQAVDLGIEAARIAQLQYRNGLITLTDTRAAQQTSLLAQADLFSAQIAYINAVVKLRDALGTFDPLATVADL